MDERRESRGVMAKALDCDIVVSEFEFQSCYYIHFQAKALRGRRLCDIIAKVLDYSLEVSEFNLHSRYYAHFQTNTLGKYMNPLSPQLCVK